MSGVALATCRNLDYTFPGLLKYPNPDALANFSGCSSAWSCQAQERMLQGRNVCLRFCPRSGAFKVSKLGLRFRYLELVRQKPCAFFDIHILLSLYPSYVP